MEKQEWSDRFRSYLEAIEAEMRESLPLQEGSSYLPFYGMMAYHMGWWDASFQPIGGRTGKRLRPLLCLLACEVAGGRWDRALPAAAAVELVHNFTLIHDDIEDRSPLRRGRPTVWSVWGIPQAINVGDGLFVLARLALLRLRRQDIPEEAVLRAVGVLDRAILCICEGQYLDLSFEGRLEVDEVAYTEMISRKTAVLLESAVHLGALVGGGSAEVVAALRAYGHSLGLAFQVQDDYLGVWGEEDRTGKPVAADVLGRKVGLPAIHAMAQAGPSDRELLQRIYTREGPVTEEDVRTVLEVMERVGSRDYVEQAGARYHRQALGALAEIPASSAREALGEIAASLSGRQM